MYNTFGDFIHTLRKERGMTQAALAEQLGVTNKAVSKWETGEAMPDTSLLLPIANIFGITVDELLNGKRNTAIEQADEPNKPLQPTDHIFTRGKEDNDTIFDQISAILCSILILGGIVAYLCIGALTYAWHPYWAIIPICALCCGLIGIVCRLCDKTKRSAAIAKNKNPYTDALCGAIVLCSIIAYLLCGVVGELWHPYWIMIVGGVVLCGIIGAIGNYVVFKRNNKDNKS